MSEQSRFILRKRKLKKYEDVIWVNTDRMPFYSSSVISLYACGETQLYPGWRQPRPTKQHYWSVGYICEGDYMAISGENRFLAKAGAVLIHYPGRIYQRMNIGSTTVRKKEIMLNNSPLISILCNRSVLNGREVFSCTDPSAVEVYFDQVRELAANPDSEEKLERALPKTIFSLFMEIIAQCGENNIYNSFDDQLKHLDALSPDLTLEKIADHFKTGKSTLNRMFMKHLNLSPFQYVISMRMRYAAQLLSSNNLSIKEVAEESGYRNTSFFISEFKKYFQKTPLEYRNTVDIFNNRKIHLLDGWNRKPKVKPK